MTRIEAAKIVAVLIAAYPSQSTRLDDAQQMRMVDTFAMMLDDITYEQCNAALHVIVKTRSWMPSIADFRSVIAELTGGPVRAGGDAWGEVLAMVSRWGAYRTPGKDFRFDDPLVAKCVDALGWKNICLSENAVADRARFIELYDKRAGDRRREVLAPALAAAREGNVLDEGNALVKRLAESKRTQQ